FRNGVRAGRRFHRRPLSPAICPGFRPMTIWNWSHTASCEPARVLRPSNEEDIRAILADAHRAHRTVKVVGARHSPGDVFCTEGDLVDLTRLNRVLSFDCTERILEVEAGTRLSAINEYLRAQGFALPNLGSISDQTISGAISTGTHGTGLAFGALHEQV